MGMPTAALESWQERWTLLQMHLLLIRNRVSMAASIWLQYLSFENMYKDCLSNSLEIKLFGVKITVFALAMIIWLVL